MRHLANRRAIVVLTLFALLFTLDAGFDAKLDASAIVGIMVAGWALAWAIVQLADTVLHGSHHDRARAIVALNVIGALPLLVMLHSLGASPDDGVVMLVTRATIAWLAAVVLWTTAVSLSTSRRETRLDHARGKTLVPLYRPRVRHSARFPRRV
jgi:hypothetical protein